MKQQSLEEIKALSQGYAAVPVVREILADTATPIGLVSLVRKESSRYFLLESLEQNGKKSHLIEWQIMICIQRRWIIGKITLLNFVQCTKTRRVL